MAEKGKLRKRPEYKMGRRERELERKYGDLTDKEYGPGARLVKRDNKPDRTIDRVVGELHGMLTKDPTPAELDETRANQRRRAAGKPPRGSLLKRLIG